MPKLWIKKVEAPEEVLPNVFFSINAKIWFLAWPFKKITTYVRLTDNHTVERCEYTFRPWFFLGQIECRHNVYAGINKDTDYTVETGYVI